MSFFSGGGARKMLGGALLFIVAACGGGAEPQIELTYNRIAATQSPLRNPVIVIPGVLGSKLREVGTNKPVWGSFIYGAADPQTKNGLRLITAPYTMPDGTVMRWADVEPDGALDEVKIQLLGIPLSVKAYAQIINALGAGGFREQQVGDANADHYDGGDDFYTAYQFAYDWRLSNAENAQRLYDFVDYVRERTNAIYAKRFGLEDPDVKVDIVAHSMGGLLTRFMLRYGDQGLPEDGSAPRLDWSGTLGVERVVLIGTPNAGSANVLPELIGGKNYGWPFLPYYPQATLGSFSALYQLMPRDRHNVVVMEDGSSPGSLYDIKTWEKHQWGLLDPSQASYYARLMPNKSPEERKAIVHHTLAKHLTEAKRFQDALDIPAAPPDEIIFNMVLGDALDTARLIEWDPKRRDFKTIRVTPGDSVVPRYSALMDERADGNEAIWTPRLRSPIDFDGVVILPYEHVELTQSKVFIDNLLYWLLVEPRKSGTPLGYPLKTSD